MDSLADVLSSVETSAAYAETCGEGSQPLFFIGVDSNQNYLHPGEVLTSMVKRVDNAVYDAMTAGAAVETGVQVMGVDNDGVAYALDEHNQTLITEEMKTAVDAAAAQIAAGEITVHDYSSDETCPAIQF